MVRTIAILTSSRADYGLLRPLIQRIREHPDLDLKLMVSGAHLDHRYGYACEEITNDGFAIDYKIFMNPDTDSPPQITAAMGEGLKGFSDVFANFTPDLLVLLGDRYETLIAAVAASMFCIPIAHIHGGELSEGAIDDAFRHSITKMSHLHFVATEEYRKRVIQLGESPDRVFNVGALAVECIQSTTLLNRRQLEQELDFKFQEHNLLITMHPCTLEPDTTETEINELLSALSTLDNTGMIFTLPNADAGGLMIADKIQSFCKNNEHAKAFTHLGQTKYFSCMSRVDAVVGNSSSGLFEAPIMRVPTINIGNRQNGRYKPATVVEVKPDQLQILTEINKLTSTDLHTLQSYVNIPFGTGDTSRQIISILTEGDLRNWANKTFLSINQ
jgi:GDP/UDP-N,N'-diacetylbacillosamine 2-epimerase (hydrolysing)